ncbi:MAG TPA: hypothetical protein VJ785_10215 [Anaerolineales bacterium]|nr:hypothetical protein [Anaerolineales bacterium]
MTRTGIDIDEAKLARNELGLWLGWTLATALGMLLGFLPSILLVNVLDLQWARVIVPLVAGFLIGLAQWAVLRNYLVESYDWVLAGGTSWAVGYALGLFLINSLSNTGLGGVIAYALFGVIVAIVQWPLLRREIPNAWVWILANAIGWGLGFYFGQMSLNLFFNDPAIAPIASTSLVSTVSGLVAGAITGLALIWIVRQPERMIQTTPP